MGGRKRGSTGSRKPTPTPSAESPAGYDASPAAAPGVSSGGVQKPRRGLSALQQKMAQRLAGGDFRQLNERLYTTTGSDAAHLLQRTPALFDTYHAGYADQVRRWPSNPLARVVRYLHTRPAGACVADMGCGEAALATRAPQRTVHSFDLVAARPGVVACDIAHTPLGDASVDVVVFCLALMGTNYGEFLVEARRVVRTGGEVLVTEVSSRLDGVGRAAFARAVEALGFREEREHAFVADDGLDGEEDGRNIGHAGKGKGKGKGNARKKGRRGKGDADSRSGSAAVSDKPFFVRFAFRAVKKKGGKASSKMPELKACVYKKR